MQKLVDSQSKPTEELLDLYTHPYADEDLRKYYSSQVSNLSLTGTEGERLLGVLLWLEHFVGLRRLDLSYNDNARFANYHDALIELNVDGCDMKDIMLDHPGLESLSMVGARLNPEDANIRSLESLTSLDISGVYLEELDLSSVPELKHLVASKCNFHHSWLQLVYVSRNPKEIPYAMYTETLTNLTLQFCDLRAIESMSLPNLQSVDFSFSRVSDNASLGACPNLISAELSGTDLREATLREVSPILRYLGSACEYYDVSWVSGCNYLQTICILDTATPPKNVSKVTCISEAQLEDARKRIDSLIPSPVIPRKRTPYYKYGSSASKHIKSTRKKYSPRLFEDNFWKSHSDYSSSSSEQAFYADIYDNKYHEDSSDEYYSLKKEAALKIVADRMRDNYN